MILDGVPGIRFDDCMFGEAQHISQYMRPQYAGVLVILRRNSQWAPKPFEPLCFVEFGNNAQNTLAESLRIAAPAAARDLFVALLPMPFSTIAQRFSLRDHLIRAYNPVWQNGGAGNSDLEHKLDMLEKKHEEQTTQFGMLLATLSKFFEPQPEPTHRPIGFLPQPVPAAPKRAI